MKRRIPILIALAFALFAMAFVLSGKSFAAEQSLTFQWEQDSSDIADPSFRGWKLYHAVDQPGGPYGEPFAVIFYDGQQQTVYSSTQTLTVPDNETHTHYFVLTAFNDGAESGYSNEANAEIAVYTPPTIPFNFSVTITSQ